MIVRVRALVALILGLAAACGGSPAQTTARASNGSEANRSGPAQAPPVTGSYRCVIGLAPAAPASETSPTEIGCQIREGGDALSLTSDPDPASWRLSGRVQPFAGGLQLTGQLVSPEGDSTPIRLDLYRQASGFAGTWADKDGQLIEIDLVPTKAR